MTNQPRRIGRYTLERELGRGGMGVVHKARDQHGREVALKLLIGEGTEEADLERFTREADVLRRLNHPGIAELFDSGTHRGNPYFVMELVPGEPLSKSMRTQGAWGVEDAVNISLHLANIMNSAHQQGIVHRDLKPENVMMTPRLKVIDFGAALEISKEKRERLTQTGEILGTPNYMAPEQALTHYQDIGPWTDVWAQGVMLYQLVTGELPFQGPTYKLLQDIITETPALPRSHNPSVPKALEKIIMTSLSKEPSERYQDAGELADALELYQMSRAQRTSYASRAAAIVGGLALLIGGALALSSYDGSGTNDSRKTGTKTVAVAKTLGEKTRKTVIKTPELILPKKTPITPPKPKVLPVKVKLFKDDYGLKSQYVISYGDDIITGSVRGIPYPEAWKNSIDPSQQQAFYFIAGSAVGNLDDDPEPEVVLTFSHYKKFPGGVLLLEAPDWKPKVGLMMVGHPYFPQITKGTQRPYVMIPAQIKSGREPAVVLCMGKDDFENGLPEQEGGLVHGTYRWLTPAPGSRQEAHFIPGLVHKGTHYSVAQMDQGGKKLTLMVLETEPGKIYDGVDRDLIIREVNKAR